MSRKTRSNFVVARALAVCAWGALCALILAAPIFFRIDCPAAAAAIYLFFSPVCHQLPDRSFALLGIPLAVCHRCFGIYLGLFAGSLIENPWIHRSAASRRYWTLAAIAPLALDALLPHLGLWVNSGISRFATGLCFGIPIASLLVRGIEEFLNEAPWQRFALGDSSLRETSYE